MLTRQCRSQRVIESGGVAVGSSNLEVELILPTEGAMQGLLSYFNFSIQHQKAICGITPSNKLLQSSLNSMD